MVREPVSPDRQASAVAIEERRLNVTELWLRGVSQREMARELGVDRRTIDRDLTEIRKSLQQERVGALQDKIAAAIAVRRRLQTEMWGRLMRAQDNAPNAPGLAAVILQAQDMIDKLEGVEAPEKVNASTIAEVQEVVMETLAALGGVEAQQEFLRRLRARTGDTARTAPTPPAPTPRGLPKGTVNAVNADNVAAALLPEVG